MSSVMNDKKMQELQHEHRKLLVELGGESFAQSVENCLRDQGWWDRKKFNRQERNLIAVPVNNQQLNFLQKRVQGLSDTLSDIAYGQVPTLSISDMLHMIVRYYIHKNGGLR